MTGAARRWRALLESLGNGRPVERPVRYPAVGSRTLHLERRVGLRPVRSIELVVGVAGAWPQLAAIEQQRFVPVAEVRTALTCTANTPSRTQRAGTATARPQGREDWPPGHLHELAVPDSRPVRRNPQPVNGASGIRPQRRAERSVQLSASREYFAGLNVFLGQFKIQAVYQAVRTSGATGVSDRPRRRRLDQRMGRCDVASNAGSSADRSHVSRQREQRRRQRDDLHDWRFVQPVQTHAARHPDRDGA